MSSIQSLFRIACTSGAAVFFAALSAPALAWQVPIEAPSEAGDTRAPWLTSTVAETRLSDTAFLPDAEGAQAEGVVCDCETLQKIDKAAASAHKTLFYENKFDYICQPCYQGGYLGDYFKQRTLAPGVTLDVGGQYRARQHAERNMRGLDLTGVDDDFLLHRTRVYGDLQLGQSLRVYGEYLDAVSNYENFSPRPIEENRSDILNLFADGLLLTGPLGDLSARVGRQEMLFADQRMISPLDWANTRRTFDGVKLMLSNESWDVSGFWTRPVIVNRTQFDAPAQPQQFYGMHSSYKGFGDDNLEFYWLAFDNDATGLRVDSIGGRYLGSLDQWLFEGWGNYQFGTNTNDSDHNAAAITMGVGRKFDHCWKPQVWVYYDWASGSARQGSGDGHFQFFPLAHKYLGFMDFFARENIQTPNVQATVQPTEKLKFLAWYYYFFLEDGRDGPYNVNGSAFQPGVAPGSKDLGQEIDLLMTYQVSPRSQLGLGYSHFFSGDYYNTPGLPFSGDADFFYTEFTVNF